jgi:ribosomal protein S18 acetylase RimI-like enzyme
MPDEEARIALFIDHENLVIGAREIGRGFDVGPIFDALAERGRVVARRAYADWTLFAGDRRTLVEHNCELIDIPQRTGAVRKNAADIKLAVDAMELAYERGFVSTFVIASGDSDFTPLVAALRGPEPAGHRDRREGLDLQPAPPACDEFLFYDRLPGVEVVQQGGRRAGNGAAAQVRRPPRRTSKPRTDDGGPPAGQRDLQELQRQLTQTLAGLKQSGAEPVLASSLKRALLRKDPTFSESDYGFRPSGSCSPRPSATASSPSPRARPPATRRSTSPTPARPTRPSTCCRQTLLDLQGEDGEVPLSGLKDQLRKRDPNWSEKDLGYAGFLQFVKAAAAKGVVNMEWDDDEGDYFLYVPTEPVAGRGQGGGTAAEIEAAGRVTVAANAEFAPRDPTTRSWPSWARYLAGDGGRGRPGRPRGCCWSRSRTAGGGDGHPVPGPGSEQWRPGDAMFRLLAVDPAARGRGIGHALFQACLDRARAAGKRRMALHTTEWMATARAMYERAGFQREPEGDVRLPGVTIIAYAADL